MLASCRVARFGLMGNGTRSRAKHEVDCRQLFSSRRDGGPATPYSARAWDIFDLPLYSFPTVMNRTGGEWRTVQMSCPETDYAPRAPRRRTDSYKHMPALTETFRLSTSPPMGMRTSRSQFSRVRLRMPSPSAPSTQA